MLLQADGKFMDDQDHQILAYLPIVPNYFSPEAQDTLKVCDSRLNDQKV